MKRAFKVSRDLLETLKEFLDKEQRIFKESKFTLWSIAHHYQTSVRARNMSSLASFWQQKVAKTFSINRTFRLLSPIRNRLAS